MKTRRKMNRRKQQPRRAWVIDWARTGRWLTAGAFMLSMGVMFSVLSVALTAPDALPLKVVKIHGTFAHLHNSDLEQAIAGLTRRGFFTVDVEKIRQRSEALPWVESVSVRRIWPDRLDLTVRERQPLAFWNDDALIDRQAVIFRPSDLPVSKTLPHLRGPETQAELMLQQLTNFKRMLTAVAEDVVQLVLDDRGSWSLTTRSGIHISLGTGQVVQRLQRLVQYLPDLLNQADKQPVSVDLRYTNGFAVRYAAKTMSNSQES
ncbi:MAG: cell division protein FtsQ/DivIB [gamma proteobacterium symbiont of Bathyaustriella thionipta]|nr:cell division protein FtsQ/DivIB [gamma proteobacterium symbiont of Bathyaustriella thionipta]